VAGAAEIPTLRYVRVIPEGVERVVSGSAGLSAMEHHFGGGHNVALTSFSVALADLESIARPHRFDVVDPWKLIGPIGGYCVPSTETAHFRGGTATIPCFAQADADAIGLSFLGQHQGTWMRLKTTVADDPLPVQHESLVL
jgi:hypothetical protein